MKEKKRLLVVSDNHGCRYELDAVLSEYKGRIEAFVHCGDSEWSPEELERLVDCPVYYAKGNCDRGFSNHKEDIFEFGDHVCFVTHGQAYGVNWGTEELVEKALEMGADLVFYGHTHVPDYEEFKEEGVIVMNPGSISRPRQKNPQRSFLLVELEEDGRIRPRFCVI